jgi:hypothetical protein
MLSEQPHIPDGSRTVRGRYPAAQALSRTTRGEDRGVPLVGHRFARHGKGTYLGSRLRMYTSVTG